VQGDDEWRRATGARRITCSGAPETLVTETREHLAAVVFAAGSEEPQATKHSARAHSAIGPAQRRRSGRAGPGIAASMRVEESIEISRPRESVWDIVSDPANDPRWCPKVRSVEPVGPARWKAVHKPVGLRPPLELSVERLDARAPARLRLREEDASSVFTVEYRLEATTSGTRFTQTSEFAWKALPRFLHKTFARGVRRDIRAQLRALKRLVEAT
jgi:carbon monoxide dehydrogenase subunit G